MFYIKNCFKHYRKKLFMSLNLFLLRLHCSEGKSREMNKELRVGKLRLKFKTESCPILLVSEFWQFQQINRPSEIRLFKCK